MEHNLTSRPNLEHLRGQAKGLLAALQAGNAEAAATLIDHLPSAKGKSTASLADVGGKHVVPMNDL